MRKLSHDEIAEKRVRIEDLASAPRLPVTAIVENVRSLYNVGSIFRTSDGALIQRLILTGFTPYPPRREIDKTALGSTKSVPWEYIRTPIEAIDKMKSEGFKICCLELTASSIPYYGVRRSDFPICLVIGNELTGISKEILTQCDFGIEIPMYGTKQSLNVAVAFGIAVFELSRIWRTI